LRGFPRRSAACAGWHIRARPRGSERTTSPRHERRHHADLQRLAIWAVTGAGTDVIAKGLVLLRLGVPVYVLMMWCRSRETATDAIPEASARAQIEAARERREAMA
jgi:hypothetical protein